MTSVRKILACAALAVGGLLVAAAPSQAHWPFQKHEPVQAPIYAAPEYGAPTMVPMARNAREEYVYSWGVPSSQVRRIQHGQYSEVSSGAAYTSTAWNGSNCGGGDCGGGCGSGCGTKCGHSHCGLFGCNHGCSSGCGSKPCGKSLCAPKCGLFGCNHGCNHGCDAAPKCEKPCHKTCERPCEKPCHKTCEKPCHKTCEKPCEQPCHKTCGGCRSKCFFSLFKCSHHGCHSDCGSAGCGGAVETYSEQPGEAVEQAPATPPAEQLPPPVPQASYNVSSDASSAVVDDSTDQAECAQPVKLVSHWQNAKCLHCNGELRPLYGPKQIAGGAFRLVCPKCKRYFVLTPTPSPITSTDQMGYYYARVPR